MIRNNEWEKVYTHRDYKYHTNFGDGCMSGKGLFQMRRHHNKEYNIFELPSHKFEGRVFDRNRRIYSKTRPYETIKQAIAAAKADCELYAKGMCVIGILVDEGKPIRVQEDKAYMAFKKEVRRQNRKKGTS
jgi:hypothetical protein